MTNGLSHPYHLDESTFILRAAEVFFFIYIVYPSSRRLCVRAWVCLSTLSNIDISKTSRLITITFYLKHHWGGGKAPLGFEPDRIRTVVSMATDSSHRVLIWKSCGHSSTFIFDQIFFILTGNEDNHIKSLE